MTRLARLLLLVTALCVVTTAAMAAEIKIGGLFAMSGKASNIGITSRDVAQMMVDDINRNGGIRGSKVKLVIGDTRSEPGQAAVALKKLIDKDKVCAVIGPTSTGEIMACLPVINQAKIPVVACVGGAAAVVPVEERYWVFKSPQKSSSAVARIYKYLKSKKMTKVGLLVANDKFGEEGEELLDQLASSYGIKIVAREKFGAEDADMSVQIGKIAAAKPKAMIVWTIGPAGGVIAKNAKALKVPFKVVQCHGQPDAAYLKVAGAAANGTIMPATKLMVADELPSSDAQRAIELNFTEQYEKRGWGKVGTHSGYAWDAVQLVARAIKKAGTDPAKIRDAIEKTKGYIGVSGIYSMSAKDHCGLDYNSLVMVEVKNGRYKLIK